MSNFETSSFQSTNLNFQNKVNNVKLDKMQIHTVAGPIRKTPFLLATRIIRRVNCSGIPSAIIAIDRIYRLKKKRQLSLRVFIF